MKVLSQLRSEIVARKSVDHGDALGEQLVGRLLSPNEFELVCGGDSTCQSGGTTHSQTGSGSYTQNSGGQYGQSGSGSYNQSC